MTTTGSTAFNLDMNDLIEEAFERCGLEVRSGYDFRTARRSLNLLTIEWANRGINLWTVEQGQILMNTGQAIYPIPVDTIDLLDTVRETTRLILILAASASLHTSPFLIKTLQGALFRYGLTDSQVTLQTPHRLF
jgi:hypothetical protein